MLKTWPLPRVCVCVLVVVVVGGGGGGSRCYNHSNIYHDPAIGYSIMCRPPAVQVGGGGGQWLQMHFTLTTRVGIRVRYITMEMSTDVK